jgi:Universal stress protein family
MRRTILPCDVAHCDGPAAQIKILGMMGRHASSSAQGNSAERVVLRNIVYLTDFSRSAEAALPFAKAMARAFDGKVYALHVLVPISFPT